MFITNRSNMSALELTIHPGDLGILGIWGSLSCWVTARITLKMPKLTNMKLATSRRGEKKTPCDLQMSWNIGIIISIYIYTHMYISLLLLFITIIVVIIYYFSCYHYYYCSYYHSLFIYIYTDEKNVKRYVKIMVTLWQILTIYPGKQPILCMGKASTNGPCSIASCESTRR